MNDYDVTARTLRRQLPKGVDLRELVRFATLAANGHNTQPWKFRIGLSGVDILPDFTRRTGVVDPDDHHLFVSLGCALENLSLCAAARGLRSIVRYDPNDGGKISVAFESAPQEESDLFDAIPHRQSTRSEYDGSPVSSTDIEKLAGASRVSGVDVVVLIEKKQIEQVLELVVAGNSAQMADAAFVRELKKWIRFNPRQALETGDGLFAGASGNPIMPTWLGGRIFDLFFRASAENDKYTRSIRSSSGVVVFLADKADKDYWVRVGRSCQRFALQATALGLKYAFINQPVEVADLRPQLARLVGMPERRPDILMRFGYGHTLPFSLRRPVGLVTV